MKRVHRPEATADMATKIVLIVAGNPEGKIPLRTQVRALQLGISGDLLNTLILAGLDLRNQRLGNAIPYSKPKAPERIGN